MTKGRKLKFAAGATAIAMIVVGLGAAGAVAASKAFSPSEESKAVIDDAAGQLGVEPDALSDALKQALKNRLDAAVEAGRLSEEQANALKERIDSGDGLPLFGGMRGGPNPGHFGHIGNLEAAAAYLGLTQAELREQLADKTLAEIAKDKGKSVDGFVTDARGDCAEGDRRGCRRRQAHPGAGRRRQGGARETTSTTSSTASSDTAASCAIPGLSPDRGRRAHHRSSSAARAPD